MPLMRYYCYIFRTYFMVRYDLGLVNTYAVFTPQTNQPPGYSRPILICLQFSYIINNTIT